MKKNLFSFIVITSMISCTSPENTNNPEKNTTDTASQKTISETTQQDTTISSNNQKKILQEVNKEVYILASGSEPGWVLSIYKDKFQLVANYGKDTIEKNHSFNPTSFPIQYKDNELSFKIKKKNCIALSGDTLSISVLLDFKNNHWKGCGKFLK
jgi:hypothetical protein